MSSNFSAKQFCIVHLVGTCPGHGGIGGTEARAASDCGHCIESAVLAAYKQGWTDAPSLDEKNHRAAWDEVARLTARLLATESAVVRTITNESERHPVGCECLLCGVLHAKPMTAEESAAFYEIARSKFKPIVCHHTRPVAATGPCPECVTDPRPVLSPLAAALPMNEAADDEARCPHCNGTPMPGVACCPIVAAKSGVDVGDVIPEDEFDANGGGGNVDG